MKKNRWLICLALCLFMALSMMPLAYATLDVVKPVKSVTGVLNRAFNLYNDVKGDFILVGAIVLIFAFPVFFYRYEIKKKPLEKGKALLFCLVYLLIGEAILFAVCYFVPFSIKLLLLPLIWSPINFIVITDKDKKAHAFAGVHNERRSDVMVSFIVKGIIWTLSVAVFIAVVVWMVAAHIMIADFALELAHFLLILLVAARCLCAAWDDHLKNRK